jgi:HIRAN domain
MPDFEVVGRGKDTNRRRKRIYRAPSEEEARLEAARDGTIPDQITLIHAQYYIQNVAGVIFKNLDNTSRQTAIRELRPWDRLTLVHEPDNQHDDNAIRVETDSGSQIGYLPSWLASAVIDWARSDWGCLYSAFVIKVKQFQRSSPKEVEFLLVVSIERPDESKLDQTLQTVREKLSDHDGICTFRRGIQSRVVSDRSIARDRAISDRLYRHMQQ